ncbi:MAG: hypothetical protein HY929_00615 [Euryarchaeota archaeon]|nr:hypothetical protein [Euryarchaeota archaeon]
MRTKILILYDSKSGAERARIFRAIQRAMNIGLEIERLQKSVLVVSNDDLGESFLQELSKKITRGKLRAYEVVEPIFEK